MRWKPNQPFQSVYSDRLNTTEYKSDFFLDIEDGDLVIEDGDLKMVSGLENFIQRFQSVLLSNKTPLSPYGLQEFLPLSEVQDIFDRQCEELAYQIVTHEYQDSEPGDPNGLGHTVEEVVAIERMMKNGNTRLIVEIKATGESEILKIDIPIYRVMK
ncbi:hypothetical protein [Paenibacillus sp. S25]|uniref:hypothetical protein n=1 Tax=Paenibacillus sp. S25 TaxID=2823905 RepID=UPI001C647607|nr:hypothetical protein [Paenibacillus sp. S25]QYK62600.1 hypothetical protein KAI37_02930 [Paenibacillus sp. S25]